MKRFTLVAFVLAGSASLQAETFTYVGTGLHGQAHITLSNVPGPDVDMTTTIGEMLFQFGSEPQVYGFCSDLQTPAGNGSVTKTTTASLNAGYTIGHLLKEFSPIYHDAGNKQGAVALQLAIWDLLYDSPAGAYAPLNYNVSMTSGHLRATNIKIDGVAFNPTPFFDKFEAEFKELDLGYLYRSDNGRIQSFVAVPEPTSIAILAIGAAALLRRRKASR